MFYEKTRKFFLNSEQKIIYAEKKVNNFLNNAKQKIILCRMQEIVYAKNSEQFELMQKINFMNALSGFKYTVNMMYRDQLFLI